MVHKHIQRHSKRTTAQAQTLIAVPVLQIGKASLRGVTVRGIAVQVEAIAAALIAEVVLVVHGDGIAAQLPSDGMVFGLGVLGGLPLGPGRGVIAVVEVAVEEVDGAADVLPRRAERRVVAVQRAW